VETAFEYTSRGWLSARKVRGPDPNSETDDAITLIEYWPTGDVKKVTLPGGAFTNFTYDDARRLTDVTDGLGNSIHYAPDNAGHRLVEQIKDPGGNVKFSLSRIYNDLGDLKTVLDAAAVPTNFAYDANGELDTTTDPLSRVTDNTLDPLGRLIKVIANTAGTVNDKATTQFEYNGRDELTAVVDPKGLRTEYTYNNLGDLTQLNSPDTQVTTYVYDAAGNRTQSTDARGKVSSYTYDALGRLTGQLVPTAAQNVYLDYDTLRGVWDDKDPPITDCTPSEIYGAGRLGGIRDESGSTTYCYDRRGNLVRKVQTVVGGSKLTVGASFDSADRLGTLTYPSGASVTYIRDTNGQISGVNAVPAPGQQAATIVSAATYLPFGPLKLIAFGNGRTLTKAYDANYNIDKVSDSVASNPISQDFTVDAAGRITGLTEQTTAATTAVRTYSYDGLDRLTGEKNGAQVIEGLTYDATGNRLTKTVGNQTTNYSYGATNHRLSSVGNKSRTYDANGNTAVVGNGGTMQTFVYDDRNRLRDFKLGTTLKASYRYNGQGEQVLRIDSTTPANSRQYVYDEAGHLLGEYTTAGVRIQEYVWLDDTLVGILSDHDGSSYQYVETDPLGTPRAVIHPSKNTIIWRWNLNDTTFGDHAPLGDPDSNGITYTLALRYPGQRADPITGLNYNYFRDYDPATGRYVESDPIGMSGGTSSYAYAGSNPASATDFFGLRATVCRQGDKVRIFVPIAVNFVGSATPADMRRLINAAEEGWSRQIGRYDVKLRIIPYSSNDFDPTIPIVNVHHERADGDEWNSRNWWAGNSRLGVMRHEIGHFINTLGDNLPSRFAGKSVMAGSNDKDEWIVTELDLKFVFSAQKNRQLTFEECGCQ
jgi:RHS repeat-associated protein